MASHAHVYRVVTFDRHATRVLPDGGDLLDLPAFYTLASRQIVSTRPAIFRSRILVGPWRQRRSKDHGNHHRGSYSGRCLRSHLCTKCRSASHSCVGCFVSTRGNRLRYFVRRLAHCSYDGIQDNEVEASWWVLC